MFCPNCRCEYRAGYAECADCHIPLVEELPPAPPGDPRYPRSWELNRRDSLNLAFIKGALLGLAAAQVIGAIGNFALRHFMYPAGVVRGGSPGWLDALIVLIGMIQPVGIVLGGYLGQNWRR